MTEVFRWKYAALRIAGFRGDSRKWEMGEWRYLLLTEGTLTRQALRSVKDQMPDWNRVNALHCTASCRTADPDWSLFTLEHLFIN